MHLVLIIPSILDEGECKLWSSLYVDFCVIPIASSLLVQIKSISFYSGNNFSYTCEAFILFHLVPSFFKSGHPNYIAFLSKMEYNPRNKLPVCTMMCLRRFTVSVNPRPQWGQRYGFSPVWVRWCVLRLCDAIKPFPQSWHTYGRSPTGMKNEILKYVSVTMYWFCIKVVFQAGFKQICCLLHILCQLSCGYLSLVHVAFSISSQSKSPEYFSHIHF